MAQPDHGIKEIADAAGRQLARLARLECSRWGPLESTLPATIELLADRAFLARQGRERFVVYFEFYSRWERQAPWYMLAKSGLLSKRVHLPTVCIAIVFKTPGYRPLKGTFRLSAAGGPTQQLWLREVCLWRTKPEPWWEEQPGLMALYPLCQHEKQPRAAIRHAAEAIERKVATAGPRDDALALLSIFGEQAYPRLDVERIIGSEKMKESKMLRRIRQEGELAAKRSAILRVLRARFRSEPAPNLGSVLDAVEQPGQLEPLLDLAATCSNLDEFQNALQRQGAAP